MGDKTWITQATYKNSLSPYMQEDIALSRPMVGDKDGRSYNSRLRYKEKLESMKLGCGFEEQSRRVAGLNPIPDLSEVQLMDLHILSSQNVMAISLRH